MSTLRLGVDKKSPLPMTKSYTLPQSHKSCSKPNNFCEESKVCLLPVICDHLKYGKKSVTNFWSLTWHKVSARLTLGGEWYQTVNITHQHHSTRLNNKFVQTSNNY